MRRPGFATRGMGGTPRLSINGQASHSFINPTRHRVRKLRRGAVITALVVLLMLLLVALALWRVRTAAAQAVELTVNVAAPQRFQSSQCPAYMYRVEDGVSGASLVGSSILMLFSRDVNSKKETFFYNLKGSSSKDRSSDFGDCAYSPGNTKRNFAEVAASFLSSPYGPSPNPFFNFFDAYGASFWSIENVTIVRPLQIDVVYTFVNPSAPSFAEHLRIRGIHNPNKERRYNDWEELRYSMRSLWKSINATNAMQQSFAALDEDRRFLKEMGFTEAEDVNFDEAAKSYRQPLVRNVYLMLSAKDQMPAWLNPETFPGLKVVTHADMFPAANESWILPTLNSNVIESGLHRIPGLSHNFLYVANDMLLGRPLSPFDLFRPLTPPRQQLYYAAVQVHRRDGNDPSCTAASRTNRRALFLEPIIHSDTGREDSGEVPLRQNAETTEAQETGAIVRECMNQQADAANKQLLAHKGTNGVGAEGATTILTVLAEPGWRTSAVFGKEIEFGTTVRGAGVGSFFYHAIASKRMEGIRPPFAYPHMPTLIKRNLAEQLLEHCLFDYTNATRAAYEREMHPFSFVDFYAVYQLAMYRALTRFVWTEVLKSHVASIVTGTHRKNPAVRYVAQEALDVVKRLGMSHSLYSFTSRELNFDTMGPLYGSSWGVTMQNPELIEELALWWLPDRRRDRGHKFRSLSELRDLYAVPSVCIASSDQSCEVKEYPRLAENYFALYHDMFQHMGRDATYRFEMLQHSYKSLITAARLDAEHDRMPLWITFNDNFPLETMSDEEVRLVKASFAALMNTVTQNAPRAEWEKFV